MCAPDTKVCTYAEEKAVCQARDATEPDVCSSAARLRSVGERLVAEVTLIAVSASVVRKQTQFISFGAGLSMWVCGLDGWMLAFLVHKRCKVFVLYSL